MVMPNVVKVKFYNQKIAFCKNDKFNLKKNLTVIVKTDRGLQFGIVTDLDPKDLIFNVQKKYITFHSYLVKVYGLTLKT